MNNFEDMCNRLDRIPACMHVDGQTDRRIDGQTSCIVRAMPTRRAVKIDCSRAHQTWMSRLFN